MIAAFLFASCAGPKVVVLDRKKYVWPPPPDKPRVKLVDIIATDRDLRTMTFQEKLFGEERRFNFKKPHGVVADKRKNIYVSDTGFHSVFIINRQEGSVEKLFVPGGFTYPVGMAYEENLDWVAIADSGKRTVTVIDASTRKVRFILGNRKKFFRRPAAVAFDYPRQRMYVSDTGSHTIKAFDLQGNHIMDVGQRGSRPGDLYYPIGIVVDKEGRLFVVNSFNFRFDMFNPDGSFVKSIGMHGDRPGMFARPKDIALDSDGHIYVTDAAFNNFQIFDYNGKVYLFVGMGGRAPGAFSNIYSIFIDKNDMIYTIDQTNRRLQIFQYVSYPEEKGQATLALK